MKPRSALAQALPRSGIREVMDLARQMEDVIVLVVGEPSFNTPAHIIDAAAKAAHGGTTKYTPNAGLPGIRAAVAERYTRKFGRPITPAEVLVTAGAVNALAAIVAGIAEEGDEILIPDPGWPNYVSMIGLARTARRSVTWRRGWSASRWRLPTTIWPRAAGASSASRSDTAHFR
jgi:aspartate/methionine/tyrosine aminotransferase